MITSLQTLLEFEEGRELSPYQDTRGIWTIAVGFNLEANLLPSIVCTPLIGMLPTVSAAHYKRLVAQSGGLTFPHNLALINQSGGSITNKECNHLYDYTLDSVEEWLPLSVDCYGQLSPIRQASLIDMGWNLGEEGFRGFTNFIQLVNEASETGDWGAAVYDLQHTLVWQQFAEVGNDRYVRIAFMLTHNEWPSV